MIGSFGQWIHWWKKRDDILKLWNCKVNTAKAEAEMAYGLQASKVQARIKEEEMQVERQLETNIIFIRSLSKSSTKMTHFFKHPKPLLIVRCKTASGWETGGDQYPPGDLAPCTWYWLMLILISWSGASRWKTAGDQYPAAGDQEEGEGAGLQGEYDQNEDDCGVW